MIQKEDAPIKIDKNFLEQSSESSAEEEEEESESEASVKPFHQQKL